MGPRSAIPESSRATALVVCLGSGLAALPCLLLLTPQASGATAIGAWGTRALLLLLTLAWAIEVAHRQDDHRTHALRHLHMALRSLPGLLALALTAGSITLGLSLAGYAAADELARALDTPLRTPAITTTCSGAVVVATFLLLGQGAWSGHELVLGRCTAAEALRRARRRARMDRGRGLWLVTTTAGAFVLLEALSLQVLWRGTGSAGVHLLTWAWSGTLLLHAALAGQGATPLAGLSRDALSSVFD